jgi:hypothetical protein
MAFSPSSFGGVNKASYTSPHHNLCITFNAGHQGRTNPLDHLFISLHPSSNAPKALRKGAISSIKGNQQGTTIQNLPQTHPLTAPLGTGRTLIRRTFHPSTNPGETNGLGRPSFTSWYQGQPRSHWASQRSPRGSGEDLGGDLCKSKHGASVSKHCSSNRPERSWRSASPTREFGMTAFSGIKMEMAQLETWGLIIVLGCW